MRTCDLSEHTRELFLLFPSTRNATNDERLGDGCFHIFLDVGANIGVHGRFLFEPEKYPESKLATQTFDEQFGAQRDNRDFCTFEFEPNPTHVAKLNENSEAYAAMGWKYNVLNVAAGDRDGSMTFYHNLDEEFGEWSFGVKKWTEEARSISIPVIRLADWLEEHIASRKIPLKTHGEYAGGPKVVMKMDVEGTEFVMLPDLILSGAICTVDYMFGEFHEGAAPLHFPGQDFSLEDVNQTSQLRGSLLDVIRSSRNCKTQFSVGDDEGYLLDGIPLPTPSGSTRVAAAYS